LDFRKFVATGLGPKPVETVPALRRHDLQKLLAHRCVVPHAWRVDDDVNARAGEDFLRCRIAAGIDHCTWNAAHEDDVATVAELLGEPLCRSGTSPILVDANVIGARLRHLSIPSDERDPLLAGIPDGTVESGR